MQAPRKYSWNSFPHVLEQCCNGFAVCNNEHRVAVKLCEIVQGRVHAAAKHRWILTASDFSLLREEKLCLRDRVPFGNSVRPFREALVNLGCR